MGYRRSHVRSRCRGLVQDETANHYTNDVVCTVCSFSSCYVWVPIYVQALLLPRAPVLNVMVVISVLVVVYWTKRGEWGYAISSHLNVVN